MKKRRGVAVRHRAHRRRPQGARRRVQGGRARERRQDLPRGPARAALGRRHRRLRLVDERPRHRLPQACTTSPTPGARPSTCRPWSTATPATSRAPAWPSRATPPPARTPSTASSWSTPRARTWSPACARRARSIELKEVWPDVYDQLMEVRQTLEREMRDMQDFEFTIETRPPVHAADAQRQAHRPGRHPHRRRHGRPGPDQPAKRRSCASSPTS